MTLIENVLSPPSTVPNILVSPTVPQPSPSLGGIAFPASPLYLSTSKYFFDVMTISSPGIVFIVKAGVGYFCGSEFAPNVPIPYSPGEATDALRASDHRNRELEWRRTHGKALKAFTGEWVVLEGEEIIAHGHDPVEVISEAREKGIRVPYVFCVEPQGEDVVEMGL